MTRTNHMRWMLGCLVAASFTVTSLSGAATAGAVPYPLPPGYFPSYDQGYATMTTMAGLKYHFTYSTFFEPYCSDELRIAQSSQQPPENADGFLAGCKDAARTAVGIFYPCDRNGDDPVCPRRPRH